MSVNQRGQGDSRLNALWGKGTRGGDSRSNALWGKGGRGLVLASITAFSLMLPLAAMAGDGKSDKGGKKEEKSYVAPGLMDKAMSNPNQNLHVIIQSPNGLGLIEQVFNTARRGDDDNGKTRRRSKAVNALAIDVKARYLPLLSALGDKFGFVVTPDSRIKMLAAPSSSQLWTEATKVSDLWSRDPVVCATVLGVKVDATCKASAGYVAPQAPAIAVIDSGVATRSDFGNRLVASVRLNDAPTNSEGDGRGHGSIVAALAAGNGAGYAGSSPTSKIVSLDILDDQGMGRASDVLAAVDWILANKDTYNIKVANFSLGVAGQGSFRLDPVNKAVEKLWFSGVTVVASSGNYGISDTEASGVRYAPANDPFVITVGASDTNGTADTGDDTLAPWSAWGYTSDGFLKPDVVAPGRYMVGPAVGTLAALFPDRLVANLLGGPAYMRMSGTSFSAAVVSGAAAQILARHPEWSPDQVKGALMVKAKKLDIGRAAGRGAINAAASANVSKAPNPHLVLNRFVVTDGTGGAPAFDASSWAELAKGNSSWNESTWAESSWAESSWAESSWAESSWNESTWSESTWAESTWAESTWSESTWAESSFPE
jgi:serine protease AprX